jgi:hypothetical protein
MMVKQALYNHPDGTAALYDPSGDNPVLWTTRDGNAALPL